MTEMEKKKKVFTVVIDYGGSRMVETFNTKKQAMRRYSAWYIHGLDMCGQVKSECYVFDGEECILHDMY